jgi:hypothetical protein
MTAMVIEVSDDLPASAASHHLALGSGQLIQGAHV